MLGTQNHGLWNMGPRCRGDDDFGNSQKGLAGGARRGPVEGGNAQEGDGRTTTTITDRSVTSPPYGGSGAPSVKQLTLKERACGGRGPARSGTAAGQALTFSSSTTRLTAARLSMRSLN